MHSYQSTMHTLPSIYQAPGHKHQKTTIISSEFLMPRVQETRFPIKETHMAPSYSTNIFYKGKKHVSPVHIPAKSYDLHTIIVKSRNGGLASERICSNESAVERVMGMKKRINSLEKQRNFLSVKNLGDKHYSSPERSERFFKESIVSSYVYDPPKKIDKRSVREQLGNVKGIYSTFLENPLMRNSCNK